MILLPPGPVAPTVDHAARPVRPGGCGTIGDMTSPPATAANQQYVQGFMIDGLSYHRYQDVWLDK